MFQSGNSSRAITQQFGCHHSTITRLHKRYQQTGTIHAFSNNVLRHHDKITILFPSISVMEHRQLPGLHPLFKVDEGLSADRNHPCPVQQCVTPPWQDLCIVDLYICNGTLPAASCQDRTHCSRSTKGYQRRLSVLLTLLKGYINIEITTDVGQEGIVIGDYIFIKVCYSLKNPVSRNAVGVEKTWRTLSHWPPCPERSVGWRKCHYVRWIS